MFEIQEHLDKHAQGRLVDLCRKEVGPRLEVQEKGYARGRASAWLNLKPTFTDPPKIESQPRGALWKQLQSHVPAAETAEIWRNGTGSSPGIHPHRDASYAARTAWLLNLGSTHFRIWIPNDAPSPDGMERVKVNAKFTEWSIALEGGELICFDCKLLHGSRTSVPERWGIGLWTFATAWKERALVME